ncbi:cation-translocating P-type ATPase C-terminal domain-containing protein [Streptomyces sp. NBC_00459]|uniref:cation-translocating P-type ATPase C-terminal domain-containing protein n=1 Tax=Streptomyces sp. NBC_00459 TaxID=2975749 RepID=UPI002E179CFD
MLTEDAGDPGPGTYARTWAVVRWTASGDTVRTAGVRFAAGSGAGTRTVIWTDGQGRLVSAPLTPGRAVALSAFAGMPAASGVALLLRAGQILWINLLTHGLTGVAMGAEPVSRHAMRRPPRPPGQHVLGGGLWQRILRLGTVATCTSLAAGLWIRHTGQPWQTTLFLALLAAQLGVVLGLRERLFTRENPFLPWAVLVAVGLAAAALYVPFLRAVLETSPPSWPGLTAALAAGLIGFGTARAESRSTRAVTDE